MEKILCVRLPKAARLEYVMPKNDFTKVGDSVIIETDRGQELGKVVRIVDNANIPEEVVIRQMNRLASKDDLTKIRKNDEDAKEMLKFAKKQARNLGLVMKFLSSEYTFDRSKIILYFTAEDRIDFRELVKIIAAEVKTRVELKQIGSRDEVKLYESIGMCGRETCCRSHLKDFKSVTIKDAKEQGLQINMDKISGCCGKLMCCLKYEEEEYKENQKNLPKYNEIVKVIETGEEGRVTNLDILRLKVKVHFGDTKENERFEVFDANKITWKNK